MVADNSIKNNYTELLPELNNAIQTNSNGTYSPRDVSLAIMIYYNLWQNKFGDPDHKVLDTFNRLAIIWMPSSWKLKASAYNHDGKKVGSEDGLEIKGLAHEDYLILISKEDGNLWHTSLAHELTHIALFAINGDGDADHLGKEFPGWTKDHSNLIKVTNIFIKCFLTGKEPTKEEVKAVIEFTF